MSRLIRNAVFAAITVIAVLPALALAQPTIFTYQGYLTQAGQPATGSFAMEFAVFDAQSGGGQVGSTITINAVQVTNGVFTVQLDFGGGVFSGPNRYLQVSVGGISLSPRTLIAAAAYAIRSSSAGTADSAGTAVSVTGPLTGADPAARLIVTNTQAGISNPSPANLPPAAVKGSSTSPTGTTAGLLGISSSQNGVGVVGIASGTGLAKEAEAIGVIGIATSPTGRTLGISGQAVSPDGIAVDAQVTAGGNGYLFHGSNGSSAPFVVKSNGDVETQGKIDAFDRITARDGLTVQNGAIVNGLTVTTNGLLIQLGGLAVTGQTTTQSISVNGNLNVTGSKNNVISLADGTKALLYANESPDYWFEDFGTVSLKNGRAIINIDPTFAEATNTDVPYKVFLTANGNTRGLYVSKKTKTSFEVRESSGGRSNISFDYRIVAKRRGYETVRFGKTVNEQR